MKKPKSPTASDLLADLIKVTNKKTAHRVVAPDTNVKSQNLQAEEDNEGDLTNIKPVGPLQIRAGKATGKDTGKVTGE